MADDVRRTADRLRSAAWVVGVPLVALLLLPFLLLEVGPAYRARFGGGTTGAFTATARECDPSCRWTGEFVGSDGSRRSGVGLVGEAVDGVGDTVDAVDVGGRAVYPRDGGGNWAVVTALLAATAGALALWWRGLRRLRAS